MNKKHLHTFTLGVLVTLLMSSCVDNNYDLNKGISTDVSIPGNTISIPVGSLKAVPLDSIINLDEIDILKKGEDNVYCISTKEGIEPIEETIDPITLSMDPTTEEVKVEFSEAEITSVHIEAENSEPAKFKTPTINLDEIDEELPYLKSEVSKSISNPQIEELLDLKDKGLLEESMLPAQMDITQIVKIENEKVNCDFSYTLPDEVETIYTIQFGEDNTSGALVNVFVNHPSMLANADKKIDFEVIFPDNYKLSTYSMADQVEKYVISEKGNTVKVNDLNAEGEQSLISFYVKEMTEVDKNTKDGEININDQIVYNVDYKVNGFIVPNMDMTRDDFKFNVNLDMPLSFQDASGVTKDVEVDFELVKMDFEGHFDNLQYIDTIRYIDFDESQSVIKLNATIDGDWTEYFHMKEGYALKVKFPKDLTICPIHSEYEGKGETVIYNENDHAIYIYDLRVLKSANWKLALQKLVLNTPVVNDECDMNIHAEVVSVGPDGEELKYVLIASEERESMMTALNTLDGDKYATFAMAESDLIIKDAIVHTETILSSIDTEAEFNLNEEVPSEIGRIEGVDFKDDVLVRFNMSMFGVDELETDVDIDMRAALPSFLKVTPLPSSNPNLNVTIQDNSLIVKAKYHPQKDDNLVLELACEKLDFTTDEFNGIGLVPVKGEDGKSYLEYEGKIVVEGDASIHGTEFHSQVLDETKEITMKIDISVSDMEVKTFHGVYAGELDSVKESIALDLGEDLAFLKEEGNSITLAEPQIEFEVENSISIPVDIDLHLYCVDDKGAVISDSEIHERIGIQPADYNETTGEIAPRKTKLFLTSSEDLQPIVGYEKVLVPGLANLLKQIPDSIHINITPIIDTSVTHHVDLSQPLRFSGSYAVNIPLKFENLNLSYSDVIEGISVEIGETTSMLKNASLAAKMKIHNTIPLGLKLEVTPLDVDGEVIEGIHIEPIDIKPGLGGDINNDESLNEQEPETIEFVIGSNNEKISLLDKLQLSVTATSNHVTGSVGLKGSQGIKISDIVIKVSGDIESE